MVFHERAAWAGIVGALVTVGVYLGMTPDAAHWVAPMGWAIGAGIAASIVITIAWGIAAGIRDREGATASDLRDRDISRFGGRAEAVVMVVAGLGVLVLCALESQLFWVANAMFAGFVIAALGGGLARVIAYRRGLA